MFYDGFFKVFIGLSVFVYSFIGNMYGHFKKSKMEVIKNHGGMFFRILGVLLIAMGILNLVRSLK